jgi:hypothetical protein
MTNPTTSDPTAVPVLSSQGNSNNEIDTVYKPSENFFKTKPSMLHCRSPNSLSMLMAGGNSFKSVRSAFVLDLESKQQKKEVSLDAYDYGYGQDEEVKPSESQHETPPCKRRRFQRRNSKTPAMLMAMYSPLLLHLDFLEDKKEQEKAESGSEATVPSTLETQSWNSDSWDGGLEIAEELVKHLQKRRSSKL